MKSPSVGTAIALGCVASAILAPEAYSLDSLGELVARSHETPDTLAEELIASEFAAVFNRTLSHSQERNGKGSGVYPLVFLHGMGDSCFNRGMENLAEESGIYQGVYSVCIPTGDTWLSDTLNGFLMTMDENVDVFAEKVRADPNLAKGFNCVGLSQGNNICRGYIQRYNDPVAFTHLSIHGPIAGVHSIVTTFII